MEWQLSVYTFSFILEDMHEINPFNDWIQGRITATELRLDGLPNNDVIGLLATTSNDYYYINNLKSDAFSDFIVSCSYSDQSFDILYINSCRLSDNRFKVYIDFIYPEDWPRPNKVIWNYFCELIKDISYDYPEVINSLRNCGSPSSSSYPLYKDQRYELLGIMESNAIDSINPIYNKSRKQPGRKHLADDIWAYFEIYKKDREQSEVYKEWLVRPGVIARNLSDPDRQFKNIIKPDWL